MFYLNNLYKRLYLILFMSSVKEFELHTSSCKNSWEIKRFLQGLINKNLIRAYDFEIDREIIEKDTEREKIIRTIKGVSLKPIKDIHSNNGAGSYFFKNVESLVLYNVEIDTKSSTSDFEDLEYKYHNIDVIRLSNRAELKDISTRLGGLDISEDIITGTFYYNGNHEIRDHESHKKSGYLRIKGERDKFFLKLEKFVLEN